MNRPKIKEVIVVEGRYDKNTLSQVVDAAIVDVGGFGIFNDKETLALLRRLARERGVIVFTDPDGAGFLIRGRLKSVLPKDCVKHAYVPDVYGKEKRKRTPGKEGKLGVEGMRPEVLLEALRRAGATFEGAETPERGEPITKADLLDAGLIGANSAAKRAALVKELDLPEHITPNALLEVLNLLYPKEIFRQLQEKLANSEKTDYNNALFLPLERGDTMADEVKTVENAEESKNFIHAFVEEDIGPGGRYEGMQVHTRFPPEPNGYLHIGHCKALTIDFGTAEKFGGICNLRMDDTNPAKEDTEFVEAIKEDIHWLGFDWGDRFYYGSDYFEKDYEYAVELIKKGLAYVCDLTPEEFKANRGDIGKPAVSPYRDRDVEENLDLFERMKNGEFPEGSRTLRAKIDLASGNFNLRDPVMYRIRYIDHHRQGTKWCIFPMYDFAHPIQDALEGITHSLCSLEYEEHRPLYDWVVNNVSIPYHKPRQIEFARLGINYTVMSKRKLRQLVEQNYVSGWDDPRMPTLCGLRRRGFTPASIRNFCERIGVAKAPSTIEYSFLEHCLREDLNEHAERTMAVLHPVKLIITNYPEGKSETFAVENNPTDPDAGTHEITFSRELWIEADDFMEEPVPKYKRLTPNGPECRLKGAYLVQCTGCKKDDAGSVVEVYATYDPDSRGGDPADGRKVKGATLHWVDAATAVDAEVRLYDYLFNDPAPDGPDKNFLDCLNPNSLEVLTGCKIEPELARAAAAYDKTEKAGKTAPTFQFMRLGYFCLDNRDSTAEHIVFNRSVSLKDSFKK